MKSRYFPNSRGIRFQPRARKQRRTQSRRFFLESLESRVLLAVDFGDAPDTGPETGAANYNTLSTDNGPSHTIVTGLHLGATVDGDDDRLLQNATANADDVDQALPDDEDGVANPTTDLRLTIGAQPRVNLFATNTTGSAATLSGWIDYNQDGVFDNATERAQSTVPSGSSNAIISLSFPSVSGASTGTTYARFRLSTDTAGSNSTGPASDGEVEDYVATITRPGIGEAIRTTKIASGIGGAPDLNDDDLFGRDVTSLGDLNGDGVPDLAVGASADDTGISNGGAVHILFMNPDGTAQSSQKIAHQTGGGPTLVDGARFGFAVDAIGDLDGDGVTELAVGALGPFASYILFLRADGTAKRSLMIVDETQQIVDGIAPAGIGDLDGDGVPDVAVGRPSGASGNGQVSILFLNPDGTVKTSQKIGNQIGGGPPLTDGVAFGINVAAIGDLDEDGVTDLAVGALWDGTEQTGSVYILFMNRDGTAKSWTRISDEIGGGPELNERDEFGDGVASLGDLDGDGVPDLAVTARNDDTVGEVRGAVYVLLLNPDGTAKSHSKIASQIGGGPELNERDEFGDGVGVIGDLDGDGVPELAVGAPQDDYWGSRRGAVHILFLRAADNPAVSLSSNLTSIPESSGIATITATLSNATTAPVTVDLAFSGSATAGSDYATAASEIFIPAGATSGSITISTVDDALDEPDETLTVDIAGVTNGFELGTQSVTLVIVDDDEPAVPSPTVTTVAPPANSHTGPLTTNFVVTFDEQINAATANPMTFAVHSAQRGQLVGSAATVATVGDMVTLTPTKAFLPGELMQASVTPAIQSTTGQAAEPFVWQVRTAVEAGSGTFRTNRDLFGSDNGYISRPALGDLDGDGDLDAFVLASVGETANRVWINDDGQFTDSQMRLGDHESLGVSLGDLDGDGDLDAFVANRSDQGNRVWINTGGPYGSDLFSDSGQSLGDHFSMSVALGDLDGDGDLDAIVSNRDQANRIWLNDGSGAFFDSGQSLGNHNSTDVALGDVDGDGDLDAFVTNQFQANRVWLNIGGSFTDSGLRLGDRRSYGVSLGDLDGDGDLDAFVANMVQANRVWINNGGSFSDSGQSLGDHDSRDVELGDLDGDGDLDALVANNHEGNRVWINESGVFQDSGQSLGDHFSFHVALGDIDNDGDLDSVVANYLENSVWLNRNPTFSASPSRLALAEGDAGTTTVTFTVTRAFNTQGTSTVDYSFAPSGSDPAETSDIVPATFPSGTLTFEEGVSSLPVTIEVVGDTTVENDETFSLTLSNPVGRNAVLGVATVEAVIRNDENVDLGDLPAPFATLLADNGPAHVATGPTLGTARDTEADGQPSDGIDEDGITFGALIFAGQLAAEVTVTASADALLDAWIDFNGDHTFDSANEQVLTSQPVLAGGNLLTFPVLSDASQGQTFARFRLSTAGGLAPTGGAADGEIEDHPLTIRGSFGSGVFSNSGQVLSPQDSIDVSLGDLDGDGDQDAFVANRRQSNTVWLNDGGVFTDSGQLLGNHDSVDTALGDVDGDGDLDAVVANRLEGIRVWHNDGGVLTDSGQVLGDHDSQGIALGDLDGDGDLDLFVANSDGQPNQVWLNDGGHFRDSGQRLGAYFSNGVALGDLDGDGDLDAFVVVGGLGGNRVWLNEQGHFTDSGQRLGNHVSARVALGDLDGDGDLDAFVSNYYEGNRIWLNEGGEFTDSSQSLGAYRSHKAALGDLDGDGDLDAFVANTYDGNRLWLNDAGSFTESGQALGNHAGFGVALGDVDGDGDLDAFVADYYENRVWLNQKSTLRVDSLTPTTTGFVVAFTQDFDSSVLNLYDTQTAGLGSADVTLRGAAIGPVAGSLVVGESEREVTFVATGGPLPADTYTVTLRSAADGFRSVAGDPLDGDGDAVAGGDFSEPFTVEAPAPNAITISIPDFVRGPGQEVHLPADTTTGIPITLSEGSGVRAVDLRISYDPTLLEITSATVAADMPAGASVILNNSMPGLAILVFFSTGVLPAGSHAIINLQARVPGSGGEQGHLSQLLDLHAVTISDGNDNEFPLVVDDALHVDAYFGDVSGNARINASDAARVARLAALLDTGFAAFPRVDPRILADISGNGRVNAADASLLARFAALLPVPQIPPIPAGATSPGGSGSASLASFDSFGQLVEDHFRDERRLADGESNVSESKHPLTSETGQPVSVFARYDEVGQVAAVHAALTDRFAAGSGTGEEEFLTATLEEAIDELFFGDERW